MSESAFLDACRRKKTDRVPVWLMRQAGRYMAVYREVRKKHDLLTICRTPELAVEVTLQPIRAFGFDAAILFTDLLIPLPPMGLDLRFEQGEGPVIGRPIRTEADVHALKVIEPEESYGYMFESVRLLKKELKVPLIGFAGAPFTLASYAIEGGHSRNFEIAKGMMYSRPDLWAELMGKLAQVANRTLKAQIAAGVDAVQLFDSWVGALSPEDYREHVQPWSRKALEGITVPTLHFGTGAGTFLEDMAAAGGDVIGVDWRLPLEEAFRRLPNKALQGNLDPVILLGPEAGVRRRVRALLEAHGGRPGWIFNLGHGILQHTPETNVGALVDEVKNFRP